jgi:predicted anti-sigma-YlaC factor YlaD
MTTAKRPGLGAVLARPAYRRLFAAQTISRWGDTFNTVALVILVFRLTGSGLGVSGVVIAEIAPVLLLVPLAGAVIDRLHRVRVMIAADLWRMTLAGLLPLVDQYLVAVYAVAFGLAAGGVFFNRPPARCCPASWTRTSWWRPTPGCGRPRSSPRSPWRHWPAPWSPRSGWHRRSW